MFTGIIEEVGSIEESRPRSEGREIVIAARTILEDARCGDSIAVDGCCLTIERMGPGRFAAFASAETLEKSAAGGLKPGSKVNLERALKLGGRLGGHMVQGHVDGVGKIARLDRDGAGWTLEVELPAALLAQMVPKGSIAIQGISLTIAQVTSNGVTAAVIPETYDKTALRHLRPGAPVNIEADIIGKYVKRFLDAYLGGQNGKLAPASSGGVTDELLKRAGFV
jgi:riboflavin synthase